MIRFLRWLRSWRRKPGPVFPDGVVLETLKYDPHEVDPLKRLSVEWRDMYGNVVKPKVGVEQKGS